MLNRQSSTLLNPHKRSLVRQNSSIYNNKPILKDSVMATKEEPAAKEEPTTKEEPTEKEEPVAKEEPIVPVKTEEVQQDLLKDIKESARIRTRTLNLNRVQQQNTLKAPISSKPTITAEKFDSPPIPDIFVSRWVDYSAKYGVGFMLSDGAQGVHFNDNTKIVSAPNCSEFAMILREKNKAGTQK